MYIQKVSDEAVEAIELGRKNHWWFRVLGDGGMIDAPVYQNGWWFEPLISSECTIPSTAMRRVDILKSAGIKIQGCIIAHEAPLLLTAPKIEPVAIPWGEILTFTVKGLAIVTAAMTAAIASVGLALVLGLAVMIDPALIVVLEDGTRIEVCSWLE